MINILDDREMNEMEKDISELTGESAKLETEVNLWLWIHLK